jgi:hypothetical protein
MPVEKTGSKLLENVLSLIHSLTCEDEYGKYTHEGFEKLFNRARE